MKFELILDDEYEFYERRCRVDVSKCDLAFRVYIDADHTLYNYLETPKYFEDAIENEIKNYNAYNDYVLDLSVEKLSILKENIETVINNIDYVRLSFTNKDMLKYIDEHPYLHNKKIVLSEFIQITDIKKVEELLSEFAPYKDRIYVFMENNRDYVQIEDAYKAMLNVKNISEDAKKLELSPMETLMYVYDHVRERIYKQEEKEEDKYESRDLARVMKGNKIVCSGYANIFNAILNYLGYRNRTTYLENTLDHTGHERNLVYVNDPKYNIDGVYCFDATFDSKKENDDNNYLNQYTYFARTVNEVNKMENNIYNWNDLKHYSPNMALEIEDILDNADYENLAEGDFVPSINYMSKLALDKKILNRLDLFPLSPSYGIFSKKELIGDIKEIKDKFEKPISGEVFVEILSQVRKIEYYQEPEKFPYSINDLYRIMIRSRRTLENHYYGEREKLFKSLFDIQPVRDGNAGKAADFAYFTNDQEIDKEVGQAKLIKVLSLYNKNRK